MNKTLLRLNALLVAVLIVPLIGDSASGQDSDSRKLGTNLDAVTDYSPQLPFTNLFLSSRSWFTQCRANVDSGCTTNNAWDTGEGHLLDLDANGWVRSLPRGEGGVTYRSVATFWDLPSEFPSGRYVVVYDGSGTLEYGLGARRNDSLSKVGRDVIDVDVMRGGILLRIVATDPARDGNYIRSIRFVAEEDEGRLAQRFSEGFLRQLAPYQALRFMDWMRTNGSTLSSWEDRPRVSDARFSSEKGVPAEVMVELANQTEKAPWFTIPHQANDGYVTQFAQLVKGSLSQTLPVYLEYSNEAWNSAFVQGAWIEARGEAEWPGASQSGFTKRINYYGKRSAEVCSLVRTVFADNPERVVCIVASQAANSWTAHEALACPLWNQGPCAQRGIKALAIAPYLGDYLGQEENAQEVARWRTSKDGGVATLFRELESGGVLSGGPENGARSQSMGWIEANRQVASSFGVSLIAYEGGQHLVGVGGAAENESLTELFTSANRHERMTQLYKEYLAGWRERGGGLFMHFTDIGSYGRYGSWGALEKIGQTSSPKYDALYLYGVGLLPPQQVPRGSKALHVRVKGQGRVTSAPTGIVCGKVCSSSFSRNKTVMLTARADPRSAFLGWKGACAHRQRRCKVRLSKNARVTASFGRR